MKMIKKITQMNETNKRYLILSAVVLLLISIGTFVFLMVVDSQEQTTKTFKLEAKNDKGVIQERSHTFLSVFGKTGLGKADITPQNLSQKLFNATASEPPHYISRKEVYDQNSLLFTNDFKKAHTTEINYKEPKSENLSYQTYVDNIVINIPNKGQMFPTGEKIVRVPIAFDSHILYYAPPQVMTEEELTTGHVTRWTVFENTQKEKGYITFKKENGEWRIDSIENIKHIEVFLESRDPVGWRSDETKGYEIVLKENP
jgi:hypothetical protein